VQAGGGVRRPQPVDPFGSSGEQDTVARLTSSDPNPRGQIGFARARRDPDRLQQLRSLLPCEVRVTSPTHPLSGQLLQAHSFQRRNGVLMLVVTLPDGSRGTMPADVTGVLGDQRAEGVPVVLSAEGVRQLHALVIALKSTGRRRAGPKTRK
jgi:hypothetical protein